jgi:hypothetical protein
MERTRQARLYEVLSQPGDSRYLGRRTWLPSRWAIEILGARKAADHASRASLAAEPPRRTCSKRCDSAAPAIVAGRLGRG